MAGRIGRSRQIYLQLQIAILRVFVRRRAYNIIPVREGVESTLSNHLIRPNGSTFPFFHMSGVRALGPAAPFPSPMLSCSRGVWRAIMLR